MEGSKKWTGEAVYKRLTESQAWVERSIVALYEYQTEAEKQTGATIKNNGVGFNGPDAYMMTYYANWIKGGKHLSGKHLEKASKKILKYSKQLAKIANKER